MDVDAFDVIVATSLESPLKRNHWDDECLECERCGKLIPARPSAWNLHHSTTCRALVVWEEDEL